MEVIVSFIAVQFIWIFIALDRINRNIIALRLQHQEWPGYRDGVSFRSTNGKIESLTSAGYKVFKDESSFEKFMLKRPDLRKNI